MKIRLAHVTNSSSQSFFICRPLEEENKPILLAVDVSAETRTFHSEEEYEAFMVDHEWIPEEDSKIRAALRQGKIIELVEGDTNEYGISRNIGQAMSKDFLLTNGAYLVTREEN